MITIYDQKNIDIRWEVFKVANNVHEDFSQSEIWMFLVSDEHKYPLHTTLDGNFVLARVDAGAFAPGTYSAVLMWLKNQETSKDLTRTELENIFALTPYEEEDTSRVEGDVTVTLKSMVATYGYDGLDAYERAILLGRFWGSEEEWMQSLGDHDLANYYTKGEVDELIDNVEVDLTDYYTKEQTDSKINEAAGGLRDRVEENTDAINDISQRVSTNTQGIADNAGNIAANTDAITENTNDINQLKAGMTNIGGRVDGLETEFGNFVGLNQSNYQGIFEDASALASAHPTMTGAGWALVGTDMTALSVYVWNMNASAWSQYGTRTYDYTDFSTVLSQVATIGSKLGDLANLETEEKTNLVGAINEVKDSIGLELFKITGVKSHIQTIIKHNANWIYHISAFSGLQGQKAKVTLKDPNGALTKATFYYGSSATGSYFGLNSGESKVITFPIDFTELSVYVGDSWVITQNPTDVEIVFEYTEGFEYRLEECEKIKPQVDENTLNLTNELEIKDKVLGDSNQGYIERNGVITFYATWYYSTMLLKAGETIEVTTDISDYPRIGIANSGNVAVGDTVEIVSGNKYTASEDTRIVISCGLNPSSIKLSGTLKIIADEKPTIGNDNFVKSNGVAESEKEIKIAGRIPQSTDVLIKHSTTLSKGYICNVGAKAGDTIIVTLTDSKGIFEPTAELVLYHGNTQSGVPYTTIDVNSPTEIKINNDVDYFTLYVPKNSTLRSGYVSLSIDYKNIFVAKLDELADDVDALKTKCEMPFDSIVSLKSNVSSTYDSGITLQAGQEIEVTLIDNEGIITANSLPLYRNSASGSYVNLVPDVPTKIQASEQTHFLLYVGSGSSWLSKSGNVTLHVEYISTSNIIDVVLPSKVYAYVGGEFNIYNENVAFITQKDKYYIFWVIDGVANYNVYSDRLRLMPTDEMIGTHTVTLQVLDRYNNSVVYSKSSTLEIVANTPVTNKKVLFIGDSLTNAGYYPHFVEYLSNNGIQSIGTRESEVWSSFVEGRKDIVHHEGRGGWSAMDYVRNYAEYRTDAPNPFWNETTGKFDFSYYISSQGYSRPDAVFINLGTNLVYFLEKTINAIKEMIASIHAYDSTIPIFVSLIIPPATQEGRAYSGHGDSCVFEKYARNQRKEYIKEFEDKLANVGVSPVYFNLDRYYDFPTAEEPVSQRNTTIVVRQTDGTHPRRFGYYKMGDVYYADLMHILS